MAAIVVAVVAVPVIHALTGLIMALAIAVAVTGGLALAAGAGLLAYRVRRGRANGPPSQVIRARPVPPPVQARTVPRELERPAEVHLHFHGVTAEGVAAILRQHDTKEPP